MAHLDVYRNPDRKSATIIPFILDIQSNLLGALPTCVVVPLARPETVETLPILRLNPKVSVDKTRLIALTQELATVPRRLLKKPVTNLSPQRDEILAALDLLITGL